MPVSPNRKPEQITAAFRIYCGDRKYDRFVNALERTARHKSRLQFWQEKLWDNFAESYPHKLPQSPVLIAKLFGIEIPSSVLLWVQMDDDEYYVVDLVQLPNGSRYLQPRIPGSETTPHTAFTTCLATGLELRNCLTRNACVLLTTGDKFETDAHGTWMTTPEANAISNDLPIEDSTEPWVNGSPPQFPEK